MAKKVMGYIKLQLPAGKATPQPPVGPALGQYGVAIPVFTKEFNERTKNDIGLIIPVVITVYETVPSHLSQRLLPQLFLSRRKLRSSPALQSLTRLRLQRSPQSRLERSLSSRCPTLTHLALRQL